MPYLRIRSRYYMIVIMLFLLSFLSLSCGNEITTIVRDINATWGENGQKILLVESTYKTRQPEEPYFNTTSSFDWEITLYHASIDKNNPADIIKNEKIFQWKEEANPGGSLQNDNIYWISSKARLVGVLDRRPFILPLDKTKSLFGKILFLRPPNNVINKIVGAERNDSIFSRNPIPSPDGSTVAVFYTLAYRPPNSHFSVLNFIHFISFFSIFDGKHIKSVQIPWPDINIDPRLSPKQLAIARQLTFLWKKDSSGVFSLDRKRAFFIPIGKSPVVFTEKVPEIPLPTKSGHISSTGLYLYTQINKNKATVHVKKLSNWTPFDKIKMIPRGKEDYSLFLSD